MKISVKVKTKAKEERVEEAEGIYNVSVKEIPEKGQANKAVIKALSRYFKVPNSEIKIISGKNSKFKTVKF